jgi:hypothetical protein
MLQTISANSSNGIPARMSRLSERKSSCTPSMKLSSLVGSAMTLFVKVDTNLAHGFRTNENVRYPGKRFSSRRMSIRFWTPSGIDLRMELLALLGTRR